ncbi:MAG: uridine phosphorylase, partial [Bacillota bacterium]
GGSATAIAVEELAKKGARLFVRAGTTMAVHVAVGDLVLAQAAVRAEGTSRTYAPLPYPAVADAGAYAAFRQALQASGYPWAEGVVMSSDGFYSRMLHDGQPPAGDDGWDEATLARWRVLGLDMETATLYVVARHLGVAAVSLCVATVDRRHGAAPGEARAEYEQMLVRTTLEGVRRAITHQQEAQR